jgi:MFS transporter, AAHS family, benzoate transport protein
VDTGAQDTRGLFSRTHVLATVLFALAALATLFAWYGLGTWLPQLMRQFGFNLGSSLTFLLALNLCAVAGSLLTAWAGDRFGPVVTGAVAALVAAVALAGLLVHPPNIATYGLLCWPVWARTGASA